jgi:hypothetical protein
MIRLIKWNANGNPEFEEFHHEPPPYAILSHVWGSTNDEANHKDVKGGLNRHRIGFKKLEFCRGQVRRDQLRYCWIDTCCIQKKDSTELAEAINSMFKWYRQAAKCYVLLSDVSVHDSNSLC